MAQKYITIQNASLHNLSIKELNIPLNKFVVITGSSGSGKTSLIYDTLAKSSQNAFNFDQYHNLFSVINDFSTTKIIGLTPVKSLKQKFEYFNNRLNYSQFLGIDIYINALFTQFSSFNINGNEQTAYTASEIFKKSQELSPLNNDLLKQNKRYTYSFPIHWKLIPDIKIINKDDAKKLTKVDLRAVNQFNLRLIKENFERLDTIIINNKYIKYIDDLIDDWSDDEILEQYIETIGVNFFLINKNHTIDQELLVAIESAVKQEEEFFDNLIRLNSKKDIEVNQLFQKLSIKKKAKSFTKTTINFLRTIFKPVIYLYDPQKDFVTTYDLTLVLDINNTKTKIDLTNPTIFNSSFSKFKCKKCKGLGEIKDIFCKDCNGLGLENTILELKIFGKSYKEIYSLTIREAYELFNSVLKKESTDNQIKIESKSKEGLKILLLSEIVNRLKSLLEIGISYIQLNRKAYTLSGGEIQRTSLIKIISSQTTNVTYILDEPSIGLHPSDNLKLISKLRDLVNLGNSVIVIEHDLDFIKQADEIIALENGTVIFQGNSQNLYNSNIPLASFLKGEEVVSQKISAINNSIYKQNLTKLQDDFDSKNSSLAHIIDNVEFKVEKDKQNQKLLQVLKEKAISPYKFISPLYSKNNLSNKKVFFKGIKKNYFKNINFNIHKQAINVITGISGSGKTTLASSIISKAIKFIIDNPKLSNKEIKSILKKDFHTDDILGLVNADGIAFDKVIYASQKPNNSTQNLLDYFNLNELLCDIFLDEATKNFRSKHFTIHDFRLSSSHNKHKCVKCKGKKEIKIEPIKGRVESIICDECNGLGFSINILAVTISYDRFSPYKFNIADFHNMSVDKAYEFFIKYHNVYPSTKIKKIIRRLGYLKRFRLGKLILGMKVSDFSGGELQRIYLGKEIRLNTENNFNSALIIIDEPTTGLHFDDIQSMLDYMVFLKEQGHTIVIIEHNLDIIYNADYIIELGPGADIEGGQIIFEGTIKEAISSYYNKKATTPMIEYLGEYDYNLRKHLNSLSKFELILKHNKD